MIVKTEVKPRIETYFSTPEDPRQAMNQDHKFMDIIAICAVICGANNWPAVASYGRAKQHFFEQFLAFPNGIPEHDMLIGKTWRNAFVATECS